MKRHLGHPGPSVRIMIVDDDLGLASGLKDALERQGYVVLVVDRGSRALDAALQFRPDLLLLDVMMPGVDGWSVLARLREEPATRSLPVIMLTAAESEKAKVHGFTLGADDYVTKPFSLQELRCRVAALLRRAGASDDIEDGESVPVVAGELGCEFLRVTDIYYAEGSKNYTNVHTFDASHLCRLSLGELDERDLPGFMRVQRSFIVNLEHVKGCGWATPSSYRLALTDLQGTTITVSRALIPEIQRRLGLRG